MSIRFFSIIQQKYVEDLENYVFILIGDVYRKYLGR